MELACTKKLLDYIGVKPEKVSAEVDPLFVWTANLIVVNRRKTVVVVHAASRCAIVLHGLTVKMLPKLPELILEGIRGLLESEYVCPETIERYLDDLGREVTFRANSSRKAVASCNKVCERVMMFPNLFVSGDLFQRSVLPWLNDDVVTRGNYILAHQILIGQLKEQYGENIQSCRVLELEVSLELNTSCKRRIVVPDDLNFYQFHNVLQECFEWKDCHLHQFVVEMDEGGYPAKIVQPEWDEMDELPGVQVLSSTDVTLWEVFASQKRIVYKYDFGDGWLHTVELCRVIENYPEPYPHCVLAVGDAPMEDCGGPDGFAHVMTVLKDTKHPEHREISEWVRGMWWQPLDVKRINYRIRDIHRKRVPFWFG